jgi:hypothetical protein
VIKRITTQLSSKCSKIGHVDPRQPNRHPLNCSHCEIQVFGRPYLCSNCANGPARNTATPVFCKQCFQKKRNPCGNHRFVPLCVDGDEQHSRGYPVIACDSCQLECPSVWMECRDRNCLKDAFTICIWCFELKGARAVHHHPLYFTYAPYV